MLRVIQVALLIVGGAAILVVLLVPVAVVAGLARAEEPVAAVVGATILAVPLALGVAALAGALRPGSRFFTAKILFWGVLLNALLAVGLVYLAVKAYLDDIASYPPILLAAAAVAAGIAVVLMRPLNDLERDEGRARLPSGRPEDRV